MRLPELSGLRKKRRGERERSHLTQSLTGAAAAARTDVKEVRLQRRAFLNDTADSFSNTSC